MREGMDRGRVRMNRGKLGLVREPLPAIASPLRGRVALDVYHPASALPLLLKQMIRNAGLAEAEER